MLSVIICSRKAQDLVAVSENIAATIGVPYEIIGIDNSQNKYGICEAYNIGASQAKYDLLCFMHEDVRLHTAGWGTIVAKILDMPNAGVLGVAGSIYQPKAPAGWSEGIYIAVNVIQTSEGESQHAYVSPFGQSLMHVAALDGLWLCCRKLVWEDIKFDSKSFPGFHFYDIDFCVRVAKKYYNYLTFEVSIEHFSYGTFDNVWIKNALEFYKKRKDILPISTRHMTKTQLDSANLIALQAFTTKLIINKLSKKDILYCVKECLKIQPFNRDNYYLLKRLLTMN